MSPRGILTAALLSLVAFLLILGSSWNDSPCFDEPEHITAGFTYVRYGIFFINPFHPPLVKDLAGLAVQGTLAPPPLNSWYRRSPQGAVAELFQREAEPQTLIRVARAPLIAFSAAFIGLFFLALNESRGYLPALLATLMLTLSPTFLAHAGFVHNDVAAAGFFFLSLWLLRGYLQHPPDGKRLLAFALVAGTAQVVKFSCLLLYPVYLVAISLEVDRWKRWKQAPWVFLTGLVIVYAVYAVHPIGRPYPLLYRSLLFADRQTLVHRTLDAANESHRLRPLTWYATGVLAQTSQVRRGAPRKTLIGGELARSHRLYFPGLLLLKVPLGLLALLLMSAWGLRNPDRELRLYLLFAGTYLLVAMASSLNLGIRHLLPLFPCLLAVAGAGLTTAVEKLGKKFKVAVAVCLVSLGLSTATTFPHYLPYFNVLSGGKVHVVDSNYDWGTDLWRLRERAQREDWKPLYLYYFGSQPAARPYLRGYGQTIDLKNLPEQGYLAASPSLYLPLLQWLELELPEEHQERQATFRRWVSRLQEVDRVGTLRIFLIGDETAP